MAVNKRAVRKISKGERYAGGIFGGPAKPYGRTGIFRSHWDLTEEEAKSDGGLVNPYTRKKIPGSDMDDGRIFLNPGERIKFVRPYGRGMNGLGTEPVAAPATELTLRDVYARTERNSWLRFALMLALGLWLCRKS